MENESKLPDNIGLSTILSYGPTILSFAGAYILVVSALYLHSYWNSFKLDVFEYIGLGDLIIHAMPSFIPLLVLVLLITGVHLSLLSVSARFRP
jgi:ABC-type dipeptide/oligopeptide/nickel transport system permease component